MIQNRTKMLAPHRAHKVRLNKTKKKHITQLENISSQRISYVIKFYLKNNHAVENLSVFFLNLRMKTHTFGNQNSFNVKSIL